MFDRSSFAFDVAATAGGDVVCALLEGGRYKLVRFDSSGSGSGSKAPAGRRRAARRTAIDVAPAEAWVYDLALSSDGSRAALAARQLRGATPQRGSKLVAAGLVAVVDLHANRLVQKHLLPRPVHAVRFAADGALVIGLEATRDRKEPGLLCRIAGGQRRCIAAHRATVSALAVHGQLLASGSWDHTVRLWRLDDDLRPASRPRLAIGGAVNALDMRGSLLAVATSDQPPRRSRARVAAEARGDHQRGDLSGAVELWHLPSRSRRYRATLHHVAATAVALLEDARPGRLPLVASGGWDFRVIISRGSRVLARLDGLSQIVTGLAAVRGRRLALSAWTDNGSRTPSCALLDVGTL